MKAVITAGGRGKRISALFPDIPKPMVEVCGKSVLLRAVEFLHNNGIDDIIITVGYLKHKIKEYFSDGHSIGVNITYFDEDEPLGNAGAIFKLRDELREEFLLINGDLIFNVDLNRFVDFHKHHDSIITLFTHPNSHPDDSTLVAADRNGMVTDLYFSNYGRPQYFDNRVNSGIHLVSPKIFSLLNISGAADFDKDVIMPLVREKKVFCYDSPEYVKDMGTEDRYNSVCADVLNGVPEKRNLKNKQKAVFLDRDGVINKYCGYIKNIQEFVLLPHISQAIRVINESVFLAILVTNQPVVARGDVTINELDLIHKKMQTVLGKDGSYLDAIYFCPHHPDGGFAGEVKKYKIECSCRKPKPGMLLSAAERFNIELSNSYLIGDSESDMKAAENAGCTGVLVETDSDITKIIGKLKERR